MVWFELRCNREQLGLVEVRRRELLDLSDRSAIADVVSTYDVRLDGRMVGTVRHRYGNGALRLVSLAADLVAGELS